MRATHIRPVASRGSEDVERLLLPDRILRAPTDAATQPHRQFLRWHRDNVFKG